MPAERVAALRSAFDETMRDPDFLAEAAQLALEVRPASGAQVRVYRGANLVSLFNVPVGQEGTLWTVFEMNGDQITQIFCLLAAPERIIEFFYLII